ncbi:MAG: isochorismate synthase [Propionibacteriaceae bacterium]|jgi:menaquinone-specific isochorismate synthase|nr:isochorismate synthase [Propionibacteriaceae bacterium]
MHSVTIPIADPGDLPRYFRGESDVAWLRNHDGMVGLGVAARHEGPPGSWWEEFAAGLEVDNELPDTFGTGPLAFTSLAFDPEHTAEASVITVPRLIVGRRRGKCWLTLLSDHGDVPRLPELVGAPAAPADPSCQWLLPPAQWKAAVAEAVSRIGDELTKVVLARAVRVATAADPAWLVRWLAEQYPTCWTYHNSGLVGASPELLVRREHGLVTSRVLAGTIRRDGDEELDLKLAHALARSSKNLVEHELAVESVAAALESFATGMNVPERPFVLELPNVLHLASDITAVVRPEATALRVAAALHPTAAVCGTPTALARETIAELECLDRGRYSGPVGWTDANGDGEFAIALRCGKLDSTGVVLYAGCGIVAESDPEEEFAETEAKLLPMLQALGLNPSS